MSFKSSVLPERLLDHAEVICLKVTSRRQSELYASTGPQFRCQKISATQKCSSLRRRTRKSRTLETFSARWENCAGPVSHLARKLLEEDVQFGQTHSAPESLRVHEELAIVSDSKPSPPPGWVQGGGGRLQLGAQSAQERESVRDHEELESRLELEALPTPWLGARGGGSVVRSSKRPRTRKSPNPRRA